MLNDPWIYTDAESSAPTNKAMRLRSGQWGIVYDNKKEFRIYLTLHISKVNVLLPCRQVSYQEQ